MLQQRAHRWISRDLLGFHQQLQMLERNWQY